MGAGNVLMRDDGIGVHVVRALCHEGPLPEGVEVLDAGTAAADYLAAMGEVSRLIVVDALRGGGEPGTIYQLSPQEIREKPSARMSLHQMSLLEALSLSRLTGGAPDEVIIIGIEPKTITEGVALSPEVEEKIPKVIKTIVALAGA